MPYDEQLKKKQRTGEHHLLNFKRELNKLQLSGPERHQINWAKQ
jgi:hypothetical protein